MKYDWSKLEEIALPEKWIEMYKHYSELLIQEDVAGFWQEQFTIANKERNELKEKKKEWISIFDSTPRFPKQNESFLYLTKNNKVGVCANRQLDMWFISKYSVTHWMPLPNPPL
jgi:hypothetical protein